MRGNSPAETADCCDGSHDTALPRLTDTGADEELALIAKALGHPARVRIIRELSQRENCMYGALAELLPLAQSTVSQHLRILKAAGLIRGEIDGPRVCYCIDPRRIRQLKELLAHAVKEGPTRTNNNAANSYLGDSAATEPSKASARLDGHGAKNK